MMRGRRMAAIALRYFYLLRGSPARVVPLFAWVGIDIVLWSFISRYLNSVASAGFGLMFVPSRALSRKSPTASTCLDLLLI